MSHGFNEQSLAIARVYAEALLGLADGRGTAETIGEELAGVVALLTESPELDRVFRDPFVGPVAKGRLLEKALRGRVDDLLVDALLVVNRKGRLALLREVAEAYRRSLEELRGEVEVQVSTAVPLSDGQRAGLRKAANHYTGRTARLIETVDESLMGGMVVRIGDRKIDNSVIKDLRRLSRQLAERGSREILSGRDHFAEAD